MSAWWGDYMSANSLKKAAEKINVQELRDFVRNKDRISEALGQRVANAEQEIQDCLEVLDFLDPDYAKRLRELGKMGEK